MKIPTAARNVLERRGGTLFVHSLQYAVRILHGASADTVSVYFYQPSMCTEARRVLPTLTSLAVAPRRPGRVPRGRVVLQSARARDLPTFDSSLVELDSPYMYRLPSAHVVEQSVRRKTRPARARAGAPPAPPAASLTALASPVRHRLCRNIVLILEIEMTKSWSTTLFPKIFPHFQCLTLHTVPQRLSV